jgi:hypothetical protein
MLATTQLTDRHDLTSKSQKLQGKSQSANGGSVQRLGLSHYLKTSSSKIQSLVTNTTNG